MYIGFLFDHNFCFPFSEYASLAFSVRVPELYGLVSATFLANPAREAPTVAAHAVN